MNDGRGNGYYLNLGEYIDALEKAGKLVRVKEPINKDTQMHPLVRLQFRGLEEKDRKAFLFENVVDSSGRKYDIPVVLCAMAGSGEIYALGLKCKPEEIAERWAAARANPIAPRVVDKGPVHDVVITGDELQKSGLSRLPVPISTPGFDNAPYLSAGHWISKDPETGVHNVGNYRGMVKSETRIGCFSGSSEQGIGIHIRKWRKAGHRSMPVAIVIGVPPNVSYTSVSRIPYDMCEYDVAGSLAGAPLELVRCKTVDLLVPAQSEIVIEGHISLEFLEMEGPFAEFTGFMAKRDYSYFMDVTCIAMKKRPILAAFLSQFPPSESSKLRGIARENAMRRCLLEDGMTNILDIHQMEVAGSWGVIVIKIKRESDRDAQRVFDSLAPKGHLGKIAIVVDEDVDARDPLAIFWALAFRMQPHRDVRIIDNYRNVLDPSIVDCALDRNAVKVEDEPRSSLLLIDATRDWNYPPIALPNRDTMEQAIAMWKKLGLSELNLKRPWYGYDLGYWSEEDKSEAKLALEGRYFETGEKHQAKRRPFET